ncbi:hypothetical protein AcW1_001647 [Taiwanofungus camphoratus]|nr:hypothetical protein AcW1_001647 [Antrodia cinnamomea]
MTGCFLQAFSGTSSNRTRNRRPLTVASACMSVGNTRLRVLWSETVIVSQHPLMSRVSLAFGTLNSDVTPFHLPICCPGASNADSVVVFDHTFISSHLPSRHRVILYPLTD